MRIKKQYRQPILLFNLFKMKVFFILILAILLFVAILYLIFIVSIKINITIDEAVLLIRIKAFKFQKCILLRFNYVNMIKKSMSKENKKNKKRQFKVNIFKLLKSLIKPFFIKNIDIYSECFEEKFSVVIEFSIVNIITKRGVLSE